MGRLEPMKIGKIPQEVLEKVVIGGLMNNRKEVLIPPSVGEDCTAIKIDKDEVIVMSTDPITGATNNLGKLAVNINLNDLASSGAEPIGLMITILLPPDTTEMQLQNLMKDIITNCNAMGIDILGGHTEVTDAVNKPIVSVTAVGKVKEDKLITSSKACPGDDVVMTKWAGLEGTAIIASDKKKELEQVLSKEALQGAEGLKEYLSVLKESAIASNFQISSMHDVTEGGILGAAWEVAFCSKVGIEVYLDSIPVREETRCICDYYHINPYRLISSGSMLITTTEGQALVDELRKNNIEASIIGNIRKDNLKVIIENQKQQRLTEPEVDELYKVIG